MTHGSLFSGIGGFDLAAKWMGWNNIFHCECNTFGQKVLQYHFPESDSLHDITQTDFTPYRNCIDVLTGGFPCQPFSAAGHRKGTDDDRYLWPEMLRAVREIQPKYVVGENVRGLTNWNGGLVLDQVCSDLELEGYTVQSFILPALAKNAPHRRDRIWIVAHTDSNQRPEGRGDSNRPQETEGHSGLRHTRGDRDTWKDFPTQPPVCSGNDGLPNQLDGITFSEWRKESIKAYGNAIVPQIALELFQVIQNIESNEL
jgi:DNA (cytosine-5)-methyltransferase 1